MSKVMSKESLEPLNDKLYLLNSHIQYQVNLLKEYLLGKVLTIVDASTEDRDRRKALKDIVRQAIWGKEFYSDEIKRIIIQFAEKFTQIPTDELKNWSNKEEPSGDQNWFPEK